MDDFTITNSNDLVVVGGTQLFETTSDLGQGVLVLFLTWYSSWFYDQTFGINYPDFSFLLSPPGLLATLLKKAILEVDGVTSVESYNWSLTEKGVYSFSATYSTSDTNLIYSLSITGGGVVSLSKDQKSKNKINRQNKLSAMRKFLGGR